MKKVAIIYSGAKYQGGIEDYLNSLFSHYDKTRVELLLISLGDWPLCKSIKKAGDKVVILGGGRIRPQTFFDIKKTVQQEGVSLMVSQGVVANFYARIGAKLAGTPHLTVVHSDMSQEYPNPFVSSLYGLSDLLTRPATKQYIAASKFLKKTLIRKGIKKDKIIVIYDGIELHTEKQKNKKTKEHGEVIIGSLGRLDKIKGYDNLIKAFSRLENTSAKLFIWGEGQERKNLEGLVKSLGLEEKVEIPGFVDPSAALVKIDIYIQPSRSEGLGLAVIQAMLAQKPVVVTPVGGMKEVITDGRTGIVAKSTKPKAISDAIKRVFDDPEKALEMASVAYDEAATKFSAQKSVDETIKEFLKTIS